MFCNRLGAASFSHPVSDPALIPSSCIRKPIPCQLPAICPRLHQDLLIAPYSPTWLLISIIALTRLLKGPCCHLALLLWDLPNPIALREPGSITTSSAVSLGLGGTATQFLSHVVPLYEAPSLFGKRHVL